MSNFGLPRSPSSPVFSSSFHTRLRTSPRSGHVPTLLLPEPRHHGMLSATHRGPETSRSSPGPGGARWSGGADRGKTASDGPKHNTHATTTDDGLQTRPVTAAPYGPRRRRGRRRWRNASYRGRAPSAPAARHGRRLSDGRPPPLTRRPILGAHASSAGFGSRDDDYTRESAVNADRTLLERGLFFFRRVYARRRWRSARGHVRRRNVVEKFEGAKKPKKKKGVARRPPWRRRIRTRWRHYRARSTDARATAAAGILAGCWTGARAWIDACAFPAIPTGWVRETTPHRRRRHRPPDTTPPHHRTRRRRRRRRRCRRRRRTPQQLAGSTPPKSNLYVRTS